MVLGRNRGYVGYCSEYFLLLMGTAWYWGEGVLGGSGVHLGVLGVLPGTEGTAG